jgi:cytochrome c-type biogenesis protein CcmH/NrfG
MRSTKEKFKMKKETVILIVVITFIVGFITGATVAILKGAKDTEKTMMVQKPQVVPKTAPMPAQQGPSPAEVASKIESLKEILKKDPKNLPAWVELGNLYFDTDQPKEAIEAYGRYLSIKPDNPDVRTDLGIMYRKIGEIDKGIEEFRKAAQIDPKHINSRYNIGIVLLHDKQDIKGAIKAWEDYLKVDPKSERAERVKGQMEKMKKLAK